MQTINLIFPHQLFENSPIATNGYPVYLVEEYLFFRHFNFHKQKIAFHRASMKHYENFLRQKNISVHYIDAQNEWSDVRKLIPALADKNITQVHYVETSDDWLEKRIKTGARKNNITFFQHASPLFLNTPDELKAFFYPNKKQFNQTSFYIEQRKNRKILIENSDQPAGGKWSFDAENRKKYPRGKQPPTLHFPKNDPCYIQARAYVNKHFPNNPGDIPDSLFYPVSFEETRQWLLGFLNERFAEFGAYQDAMDTKKPWLHHGIISPMLNTGLITPSEVLQTTLQNFKHHDVPLNSLEGFIRQILGWREFIRGIYLFRGVEERTKNFWNFNRKIPSSFYDGSTGIEPVDLTIKKVLRTGYCHHIERLMVLGNFMLLCEFDPDEVYRWFMELFIDAYDWVMVPNVYGMSQFADGGLMANKPYISGSNYLRKMSNFPKGPWQETWDALFWRFIHVHRDFFSTNPRLGMLLRSFDKMPSEKRQVLLKTAENYLATLDRKK